MFLVAVASASCAKAIPEPTRLELELPPGIAVTVDAQPAVGNLMEVTPGEHTVGIETPCGARRATVQVEAEQTTQVGVEAFPDLAWATLVLKVSAPAKEKPKPTATLTLLEEARSVEREDHPWPVPEAVFQGGASVPACNLRLIVSSGVDTLGGYWEDLGLTAGVSVRREVRLAPGPDMVRIEGGEMPVSVTGPVFDERGRLTRDTVFERKQIETFEIELLLQESKS